MERVGLDTGFFIKVFEGDEQVVRVWKRLFHKLGRMEEWDGVREAILLNCEVVPVDVEVAENGASISHGTGLPSVDALIYAGLKGADKFYTADRSFDVLRRKRKPRIIML